jgi:hypothetical protein
MIRILLIIFITMVNPLVYYFCRDFNCCLTTMCSMACVYICLLSISILYFTYSTLMIYNLWQSSLNLKNIFALLLISFFYSHAKWLPWAEDARFFSFCWLALLLGPKLSLFCFISYLYRHVVINLCVRLEITLQWSAVALCLY